MNFLPNTHKKYCVARRWEQGMGVSFVSSVCDISPTAVIVVQYVILWYITLHYITHSITYMKTGPLFAKKMPSYRYRDPHDKPEKVWRPSQVYNGNLYTDKTASS